MKSIIFKIPVYNEEKSIYDLIRRISEISYFHQIRVDIYNDGSNTSTFKWLQKAKEEFNNLDINIYNAKKNRGLLTALNYLITGFDNESSFDNVAFLDGDNTHNPQQVVQNLDCLDYDLSIFSRYTNNSLVNVSFFRQVLSVGAGFVYKLALGIKSIKEYTCLYRIFNKSTFQEMKDNVIRTPLIEEGFVCAVEMLFMLNLKNKSIKEFPLHLQYDLKVSATSNRIILNIFRSLLFALKKFILRFFS